MGLHPFPLGKGLGKVEWWLLGQVDLIQFQLIFCQFNSVKEFFLKKINDYGRKEGRETFIETLYYF